MKYILVIFCILALSRSAFPEPQMIRTPAGMRDASKFHVLKPGQSLRLREGRYEVLDPNTHEVVQSYPVTHDGSVASNDGGWMTYAEYQLASTDALTSFTTTWTVPAMPPNVTDGQLLYLFNGLSDINNTTILQPVLQWGVSPAGGGAYWAVASWYVTSSDESFSTTPVEVDPGTVLTGTMAVTDAQGDYSSTFNGIATTQLVVTSVPNLVLAYETLEVYGVVNCDDYPTGDVAFGNIGIVTSQAVTQVNWVPNNSTTSNCGLHTTAVNQSAANGEVDLYFQK